MSGQRVLFPAARSAEQTFAMRERDLPVHLLLNVLSVAPIIPPSSFRNFTANEGQIREHARIVRHRPYIDIEALAEPSGSPVLRFLDLEIGHSVGRKMCVRFSIPPSFHTVPVNRISPILMSRIVTFARSTAGQNRSQSIYSRRGQRTHSSSTMSPRPSMTNSRSGIKNGEGAQFDGLGRFAFGP